MSDIPLTVSFPLDSDGFLRRACPTCTREFKWFYTEEEEEGIATPDEYYCPYCGVTASPGDWCTDEQLQHVHAEVFEVGFRPALDQLSQSVQRLNRAAAGGPLEVSASIEIDEPEEPPTLFEPGDMKQVAFSCHPSEPVKVEEMWEGPVHCICCGGLSDAETE